MTDLIEKYFAKAGKRHSAVLLLTLLVWTSMALGVVLYFSATALYQVYVVTRAAFDGGTTEILLAVAVWVFILLSVPLVRGVRTVWLEHRNERRQADVALTKLSDRLYPNEPKTAYLEDPRERLALRALEAMEREVLGAPQATELSLESRLIALEERAAGKGKAAQVTPTEAERVAGAEAAATGE